MSALAEIDALRAIDDALTQLEDQSARDRVLGWAWAKYSKQPLPASDALVAKPSAKRQSRSTGKKKLGKLPPSIVKDLNLGPEGKQGFNEFASKKKPPTNQQKCTVAVYYLSRELEVARINTDHVFTCFKDSGWRVPADLYNTLGSTAHKHGWLDTSDMDNILLTTRGETMVEHDLPKTSVTGNS